MTDAPTIGVVGSPDVASALRSIGFQVVDGADFRSTATEISQRLKGGEDFPVIVADQVNTPALSPWTIKTATQTHLVVLGVSPGTGLMDGKPERLELPASVNDLLGRLRYQATMMPVGAHNINVDGTVSAATVQRAVEDAPRPLPVPAAPAVPKNDRPDVPETASPAVAAPSSSDTQGFPDDLFTSASTGGSMPAPVNDVPHAPAVPSPAPVLPPAPVHLPEASHAPFEPSTPVHEDPLLAAYATPVREHYAAPPENVPQPIRQHLEAPAPHAAPISDEDFFSRRASAVRTEGHSQIRPRGVEGDVIINAAGRGGAGKTTCSLTLADVAAEMGLSVVVVDANRGQPDLRKYLRLGDAPLRTAYDAYTSGDPSAAVLRPTDYAFLRQNARLDATDFALVLGPPAEQADPRFVSAAVYAQIIAYARTIADLVIVDTQIIEAHRTDIWNDLLIPLLRDDAWLVAITDESSPGVSNLLERLGELQRAGVPNARTLVLATQYDNFTDEDARFFQAKFQSFGTLVGATSVDITYHDQMNMGRILSDSPAVRPAMNSILSRVTGRTDLFDPAPPAALRKKHGFLGGLFGGRK